jgi:hypothetical protein
MLLYSGGIPGEMHIAAVGAETPLFRQCGSVGFSGPPRATRATHDTGTVRTVVHDLLPYSFPPLPARPVHTI